MMLLPSMPLIPIVNRIFYPLLLSLCLLTSSSLSQEVLTEAKVIELSKTHTRGALLHRAHEKAANATIHGSRALPNPLVAWQRETVGNHTTKDALSLTLPLSIRPRAERALARSEAQAHRTEAAMAQSESVAFTLALYFRIVLQERLVQLLEQEQANLQEALRILERRKEEGSASGYERSRLVLESEASRSRLEVERSSLRGSRGRLAAILHLPNPNIPVQTSVTLPSLPPEDQVVIRALSSQRPLVRARQGLVEARNARDSASILWIPHVSLMGGINLVHESQPSRGYLAGIAIDLPIFSHGQDIKARADMQHAMAEARVAIVEQEVRAEIAEAAAAYEVARQEWQRLQQSSVPQANLLLQAARSGFREGIRSVVELLDAERTFIQVAQTELALLAMGKSASLRLRTAMGEW